MLHEGPGWSVHSPGASALRTGGWQASPVPGMSFNNNSSDRNGTAHTRNSPPMSVADIFASQSERLGAGEEFLGEYRSALSPGISEDGSRQAVCPPLHPSCSHSQHSFHVE